jgi:cobalt-zinc-cadmium efflux system outer membrane protein
LDGLDVTDYRLLSSLVGLFALLVAPLSTPWHEANAQTNTPDSIDLGTALALARENSPLLEVARARLGEAQGDVTTAGLLLVENPEVDFGAGRRFLSEGGGAKTDFAASLSQRFETGGQRRHRIARAEANYSAAQATAADVRRVVSHAVGVAFFEALTAGDRAAVAAQNAELAENLYEIADSRVKGGAAAPLELHGARIRLAEARRRLLQAQLSQREAEIQLARVIGIAPPHRFSLVGELPRAAMLPTLDELLQGASVKHPRVQAAQSEVDSSRSAVKLADAEAWPDISLGVGYDRDGGDDVVGGRVTVPLPLFDRKQGERARARARARRAVAEQRGRWLEVEADVRRSFARYEIALEAVREYDAAVLRAQEESLQLMKKMFEAGKIQYVEVVLLQRELLEGRLGYLDARLDLARSEVSARAASGLDIAATTLQGGQP